MPIRYVLALLSIYFMTSIHASTSVVSQLYDDPDFTAPTTPTKLNTQLTELVNTVANFTTLSGSLQRALLWSTGWVQVVSADSSSSASNSTAEYVQVYVLCGRTMSDVFLSAQAFDNETECELENCKTNVISYTKSTCDPTYVAAKARCALASDVNVSLTQKNGPMWSLDGDIDPDTFDPQPFQYNDSATEDNTTLYMLAQQSSWDMDDTICSNYAMFIAPCIQADSESVNEVESTWCEPEIELSVLTWLSGNSTAGSTTETTTSSGGSHTSAAVGIGVGCAAVVLLVLGLIVLRRRRSRTNQAQYLQTGLWDDDVVTANRIPRDKVRVLSLISRGAFGEVYAGTYNNERVAIKMLLPSTRRDIKMVNEFLTEAKLTATMEHPRIVACIGIAWDSLSDLCVVLEFMDGGDLRTLLSNYEKEGHPTGFDREEATIALHVAHALTYLHSLDPPVIHRDLKSRNILLNGMHEAKLIDFGISRERLNRTMTAGVGTSLWMAPEVMTGEKYDDNADIFSFGVVLSELDSHTLPYTQAKREMQNTHGRQMTDATLLQRVAMGTVAVAFSPAGPQAMIELGNACVSMGPSERPSAAEALFKLQVILSKEMA